MSINWTIISSRAADKQAAKLSETVMLNLRLLFVDLATQGPAASGWPNYSKLQGTRGDKRHCHLQKGKPTYVACWVVLDKKLRQIEVYYVGTHEKAPY